MGSCRRVAVAVGGGWAVGAIAGNHALHLMRRAQSCGGAMGRSWRGRTFPRTHRVCGPVQLPANLSVTVLGAPLD